MPKGLKSKCQSTSHQILKEKAKNRVNDLQGIFTSLQSARKESRTSDIAVLEEQVHQMLREWNAELTEPSPASSFVVGSFNFLQRAFFYSICIFCYLNVSSSTHVIRRAVLDHSRKIWPVY